MHGPLDQARAGNKRLARPGGASRNLASAARTTARRVLLPPGQGVHSEGRVAELRAGLLYELASKKQEAHSLGLEVANLSDALAQLREDHGALALRCDEAEASRRAAEERAEGLNRQLTQDTQQLASLRSELSQLEQERQATLRFVEELSDKNMRLESIAREAAAERSDMSATQRGTRR